MIKTRVRLQNEMERVKYRLRKRYGKLVSLDSDKRMSRMKVQKLQIEQKEHLMYLLALEIGAPYRHDLGFICRKLNITIQAGLYLMNHSRWPRISEKVMDKIRDKYMLMIHGKALQLAMQGSKYHMDLMFNLKDIVTKRIKHIHETSEKKVNTEEEKNKEIAQLLEEMSLEGLDTPERAT